MLPEEWTAARTNPHAVWGRDNYNEEVCSLLTTSIASTGRKLAHEKAWIDMSVTRAFNLLMPVYVSFCHCHVQAVTTSKEVQDTDPADALQDAMGGSLHQETRVFDFGRVGLRKLCLIQADVHMLIYQCLHLELAIFYI